MLLFEEPEGRYQYTVENQKGGNAVHRHVCGGGGGGGGGEGLGVQPSPLWIQKTFWWGFVFSVLGNPPPPPPPPESIAFFVSCLSERLVLPLLLVWRIDPKILRKEVSEFPPPHHHMKILHWKNLQNLELDLQIKFDAHCSRRFKA